MRIVAAAILHCGKLHIMPTPARHHDILGKMYEEGIEQSEFTEQGFLTSEGEFVDREEACIIAEKAGQLNIVRPKTGPKYELFSEDLW